ncbi:MliC family protein [Thermocoleostomius sinensis]|jgi:membrane-bound inhibitor of C-type lysozyme|uniref:MliC family protein n=1 Tax=Thermocoleostomius sinensis A174 TaxID=2016057 RepID=A0A9E8ZIV7_9CYAN|nr:MliC family protein [Thermocoleostomius sinensis]WAL62562.1 MliC family protein [Thermocoleostomius sinensis A174]
MKTVNIGVLLLPVALATIPLSAEAQVSRTTYVYQCDEGGTFKAEFVPEGAVVYLGNETLTLEQIPAASGARYSDGSTTLYTKENEAFVEVDGETVLNNCTVQLDSIEGSTEAETTIDGSVTEESVEGETTTLEESATVESTRLEGTTTTEQTTIQRTETTQQTTTPAPAQTTPAPAPSPAASPAPVRALW